MGHRLFQRALAERGIDAASSRMVPAGRPRGNHSHPLRKRRLFLHQFPFPGLGDGNDPGNRHVRGEGNLPGGPVFSPKGCYCDACRAGFKGQHGLEYAPEQMKDPLVFHKVLTFKQESIARFVRDVRKSLKSVNPDAVLYMNGLPLGPGTCGRDNRRVAPWQDALLAEGGFLSGDLRGSAVEARGYGQMAGNPGGRETDHRRRRREARPVEPLPASRGRKPGSPMPFPSPTAPMSGTASTMRTATTRG